MQIIVPSFFIDLVMNSPLKKSWSGWLILIVFPALILPGCQGKQQIKENYSTDPILSWNELVYSTAVAEDKLLTLKGLRTATMGHIAMHDVLNSIKPVYDVYLLKNERAEAHPIAGIVQAGYEIAVSQYPDKKDLFVSERERWLAEVEQGSARENGIQLGKQIAMGVLRRREEDKWDGEASYTWHPMGPGVYAEFNEHSGTPEGFVFGAGWAKAEPFILPSQDFFRSPPPPEIKSKAYLEAFNEVKSVGRTISNERTADQQHLAMWWKDFVENSHNRLARQLMRLEQISLWEAARTFALLNMSIYDAYVSVFDNKFYYNHWRPFTAIRWAANDGNPETIQDTTWNNLHRHTYAFPSYPSAHGTASAAAMTVLGATLGLGDTYGFTMYTSEVDSAGPMSGKMAMLPESRQFSSFSEAATECAMSRLYLGIHFRYDSEAGFDLGQNIGNYLVNEALKPME